MLSWFLNRTPQSQQSAPDQQDSNPMQLDNTSAKVTGAQDVEKSRVFLGISGATVCGRPSSGGLLMKQVNLVDLQFLGVSRMEPTVMFGEFDQEEEDGWCERLRKLAPKWFRNRREQQENDARDGSRMLTAAEIEEVFVAWPSTGGVWVLKFEDAGQLENGFGVYNMCMNMDERAEVLKKFGAEFYENPDLCVHVTKAYEERMRKEREELDRLCG